MKKRGASKLTSKGSNSINTTIVRITRQNGAQILSPPRKKIHTRAAMITCCDFGVDRQQQFPSAFFCHGCDMWERRDVSNKRLHWEMRVYSCTATHSLYGVPQQAKEWSHGVAWSTKEGSAEEFDDADDTYIPLPPPKIQNT